MKRHSLLLDLLFRRRNRRRNAALLRTAAFDQAGFVRIGGIEQWIRIRGEGRANPILLLVHGGPASPYSIFSPLLRAWEQAFTIVQWDQRGAGKTWTRSGKSGPLTFAVLVRDGLEVAAHAARELGQRQVVLVGSSVGSITALKMAKEAPALFNAYVGVDQNVGGAGAPASRKDFERTMRALIDSAPEVPHMIKDLIAPAMLSSPDHGLADMRAIFQGMQWSLDQLYDELMAFDARALGVRFEVPFIVIQGERDVITPTAAARRYFDEVEAPRKAFHLVPGAGHLAMFAQPALVAQALAKELAWHATPTIAESRSSEPR